MKNLLSEISTHKFIYLLFFLVLLGSVYVRLYNTREILGFYYDQGRDALVIWDFIKEGDIYLVGPTTGIRGILRGPWYYWLITPFYFLGGGNPVVPADFLALTTVFAIFLAFLIGNQIAGHWAGLTAAVIAGFSYYMVVASRWLSNPTPMLLISMLLVWALIKITENKKWWIAVAFLLGISMQFGSATETFYIPAVAVFAILNRKSLPSLKIISLSACAFLAVFLPQIIFDVLKGGVLSSAVRRFLVEEESFKLSFWEVVKIRLPFYWDVFMTKIWLGDARQFITYVLAAFTLIVANIKTLWKNPGFKALVILGLSPLIGMIFFQGNEGNVFDYYFTGYYLIYILIFSVGLSYLAKSKFGFLFLALFLYLFLSSHLPVVKNYLANGRSNVNLKEQLEVIDWVYTDAGNTPFNVDAYVPPVIPYAYDYLFKWQGSIRGKYPQASQVKLLYTVYEEDTPIRLDPWLKRQDTIGKVEEEKVFRGLTVQKRNRYIIE